MAKPKDENAKNDEWQTPMDMPGLKKNRYNNTMSQSAGSQVNPESTARYMKKGENSP